MRPVRKGISPVVGDFNKYEDAKTELVSRLGLYCSYCERQINTLLAVEHIEPKKGDFSQPHLAKRWSNFLLACTNCNSCKSNKKVDFKRLLFPDRDNSYHAYIYQDDGTIIVNPVLLARQQVMARNTLRLVGLDKPMQVYKDSNDEQVALDRSGQRMEVISTAKIALGLLINAPENQDIKKAIEMMALPTGYFSIWMKIFDQYPDMKSRFIRGFKGTEGSGCFDIVSGDVVTPAPNPNGLAHGGKV